MLKEIREENYREVYDLIYMDNRDISLLPSPSPPLNNKIETIMISDFHPHIYIYNQCFYFYKY
jgi:hypothetical protein